MKPSTMSDAVLNATVEQYEWTRDTEGLSPKDTKKLDALHDEQAARNAQRQKLNEDSR